MMTKGMTLLYNNGITITPTSILIHFGSDKWAIDRATGIITPHTDRIPIVEAGNGLAYSCFVYASYYYKIPDDLHARWVEVMIKWHNVQLNVYENWEAWLAWLERINPADYRDNIIGYNSLGCHLFNTSAAFGDIVKVMMEEGVIAIGGIKKWVALIEREQIRVLLPYDSADLRLYCREKIRHHDDFASVRNIWHDFCKVMGRRAREKDVSCGKGKKLVSH